MAASKKEHTHPVQQPVMAASEKTIKLCSLSQLQAKENNKPLQPIASTRRRKKKNQPVSWMASQAGKSSNLTLSGETNNQTVLMAINTKKEQQSTSVTCCGHNRKNPTKRTASILCRGLLSRPMAASKKKWPVMATSEKNKTTIKLYSLLWPQATSEACCICKKKKKEQLACELDGKSSRKN